MTQILETVTQSVDWADWLRRWDAQQSLYLPDREGRFQIMLDALDVTTGGSIVALDLACGPGSISQRLLARFPEARAFALDTDPVLLAIGQGALGTQDGRLTWIKDDLTDPAWADRLAEQLGDRKLDAVLSSTALHWPPPDVLARVYHELGRLMRPGGVFLNADHMAFGPHQETFRTVAATLKQRLRETASARSGAETWEGWWKSIQAEPAFAELVTERERRLAWRDRTWANAGYDFQVGALHEAGFREVGVIWQRLDNRVLMAVR